MIRTRGIRKNPTLIVTTLRSPEGRGSRRVYLFGYSQNIIVQNAAGLSERQSTRLGGRRSKCGFDMSIEFITPTGIGELIHQGLLAFT
jgi:hypothetical protein